MAFLNPEQEQQIEKAIGLAENQTSGEIRLHTEQFCDLDDTLQRALEVFYDLEMDKTQQQNGILIYIAYEDKKMAIVGDEGINNVVPKNYWDIIIQEMKSDFAAGNFEEGICKAVHEVGEKLKQYFPWNSDDKNELSDKISNH
ncbi:MAG: TPM domain-containing protein [Bacteroidota bacterium]|nr:TPM domain-containing protein [Bacteroidota bacterium]